MPIRKENLGRYPPDWPQISARIIARADYRCEQCGVPNGAWRHKITDEVTTDAAWAKVWEDSGNAVKIVLTVAHLGLPAQLPFNLHVAGDAEADEIGEFVGSFVAPDAEAPEWLTMMHDRAAAQFFRGPPASGAGFFISLPSGASCSIPRRSVIINAKAAAPIWISLTRWCLLDEPSQSACVSAEASARSQKEAADRVRISASFAPAHAKTALGFANRFRAAGVRTSAAAISRLLSRQMEVCAADNAVELGNASSGHSHDGILYHFDEYPENCSAKNLQALCQSCHNRYDAPMRAEGIKKRRHQAQGQKELF